MSRLIDADEAIDYVNNLITVHRFYHPRSTTENFPISEVIAKINEVPRVDAVPAVHGHWVFSENDDMFYCTNCKNGSVRNDYPYCHWCGAKMDEVAR